MRFPSRIRFDSFLYIFVPLFMLSGCIALDDPLPRFKLFISDIFRLQLDGEEVLSRRWDFDYGNEPPAERSAQRAVRLSEKFLPGGQGLTCDEVELGGYDDWLVGARHAAEARRKARNNTVTSDMNWPNFWVWYSPVLVVERNRRSFFQVLRSATFDVAIFGTEDKILQLVDSVSNQVSGETLADVLAFNEGTYRRLYDSQLADKSFVISDLRNCGNIQTFTLTVQ